MAHHEGTTTFTWQGQSVTTWYRVTGNPEDSRTPLIVAHGGPGATHDYLLSLCDIAKDGRRVVHYDQAGNGRSSHFPNKGADFYTVEMFVTELTSLIAHLHFDNRHVVLGQAWGGFLAQEYALTQPQGLSGLVLADTSPSYPAYVQETLRLRELLPPETQKTLVRHEQAGTTDSDEYAKASEAFNRRHVCRLPEWPEELTASLAWIDQDPTVYHTLNGPSKFHVVGSLKDWSALERIDGIEVSTLILSGTHDEAGPSLQELLLERLPEASWHRFEDSSHMPHWEEREKYMEVLEGFLARCDAT